MSVSTNGFAENVLTFKASGAVTLGTPVKMSANNTVAACAAGNPMCGVAVSAASGHVGVQLTGIVTLPYSGTAPAVGFAAMTANGSGGVKADTAGQKYLVTAVDTVKSTVTFML